MNRTCARSSNPWCTEARFLFLNNSFGNYLPIFRSIEPYLDPEALILADNAGVGAEVMRDYLEHVRKRYSSRTRWFETDLTWSSRDAMEITEHRRSEEPQ